MWSSQESSIVFAYSPVLTGSYQYDLSSAEIGLLGAKPKSVLLDTQNMGLEYVSLFLC